MSADIARSLSPVRRKLDVLAASNKRKRITNPQSQPRPHELQHNESLDLFVRGRSMPAAHTAAPAPPPQSIPPSPPSATAQLRSTAAIDLHTDSLIGLLSQHYKSPQPVPEPPSSHSPRRHTAQPPSPPRARSPPPPTPLPPHAASPAQPLLLAQLIPSQPSRSPPSSSQPPPPPPASLSAAVACPHSVTATSPSAPKSTIASYIHRFRTQPPLDERERRNRLQQHHERPHRDFWWLRRRHSTDDREDGNSESETGSDKGAEVGEIAGSSSGSKIRLSILPAIEAVLSEEERRVTAELARWSRSPHPPPAVAAQPHTDASVASLTPQHPSQPPASLVPFPNPPPIAASSLAPPTVAPSFVSPFPTDAPAAAPSLLHPPQPTHLALVQYVHHAVSTAAAANAAPLSTASLSHRDNILRLARELRLPGLSSVAAHELPSGFPAPPLSDQWTAAPLADSYSLIPRRVGQWTPLSPARLSTVSPLLSASAASSIPPSQAASLSLSRAAEAATAEEDVDVDDILAQWRRNHRTAHTQHTAPPAAAQTSENTSHTAAVAKSEGRAIAEAEDKPAHADMVVEQVVDAVMKRLKEEKKEDQIAATAHAGLEVKMPTPSAGDMQERKANEHIATPPAAVSPVTLPSAAPAPLPAPSSGSKWRDRKKSLSLQLPPHPNRVTNRPPLSAASNSASSATVAVATATSAASLRPQQTHWVAPARSRPPSDVQPTVTAPAPVLPSPARPAVSLSSPPSLLTGALSALVSRALTCPAPSFADHVHSAMSSTGRGRAASENGKQLRMEDLEDEPSAVQRLGQTDAQRAEEKKTDDGPSMDRSLFGRRAAPEHPASPSLGEQSTLVSSACPPAPLSSASASLPVTFSPILSLVQQQQRHQPFAAAIFSATTALSASAVTHTSVPHTAVSSPFASVSLDDVTDAMQASFTLPFMARLPSSSSSQTALQVQLYPNQPAPLPFFTLPASMAALYALTSSALQHAGPVFIPIMVSAPPPSSSPAPAQPPHPPASAQIHLSPPILSPAVVPPPSSPRPAARPAAVPVNLEVELADLLSSLHVSASLFADEPRLQTVVSRMRQTRDAAVST